MEYPPMILVSPAYASKSEDLMSTAQGGGPQILSAFVKQRTYQPLPARDSAHPNLARPAGKHFGRISKAQLASREELTTQTTQSDRLEQMHRQLP